MRFFLLALMLLGLLTGGTVRAGNCGEACEPPASDCCQDHGSKKGHPEDQCPEGHHHHSLCCHVSPAVSTEDEEHISLAARDPDAALCRPQSEMIPEGPFLSSEKPPLI